MGTMKILNKNCSYFQILNVGTQGKRKIFPQNKLTSRCKNLCHRKL